MFNFCYFRYYNVNIFSYVVGYFWFLALILIIMNHMCLGYCWLCNKRDILFDYENIFFYQTLSLYYINLIPIIYYNFWLIYEYILFLILYNYNIARLSFCFLY